VIAFFTALYADRYRDVWEEFRELGRLDPFTLSPSHNFVSYRYSSPSPPRPRGTKYAEVAPFDVPYASASNSDEDGKVVSYSASRLLFKANIIDPLRANDRFRIITPAGTFEMSKADFLRVFHRVTLSATYREKRIYHYPSLPRAASQFLIHEHNIPVHVE